MRRRAQVRSVVLCAGLLGAAAVAGCVETTTRTSPRASEQDVGDVVDRQTSGAGSKAGHGSRAPSGGAIVKLPDVGDGAPVHRSGITFPEQVGSFRRVRAYLDQTGSTNSAEYADAGARVRIVATLRDRAGISAPERYEQMRAELESAGAGALPPAGDDDPDRLVLLGSTAEDAGEAGPQVLTSYRVEAIGPDFLEYRATFPASRAAAGAEALRRFRSDHAAAAERAD